MQLTDDLILGERFDFPTLKAVSFLWSLCRKRKLLLFLSRKGKKEAAPRFPWSFLRGKGVWTQMLE